MFEILIKKILKGEKVAGKVDLSFVRDKTMRGLNRRFRKKDQSTDVLAFPYGEKELLGDVIISSDTARRNAKSFGVAYREEVKRLVIHGVLHVLGYDHGSKMRNAEKIYTQL